MNEGIKNSNIFEEQLLELRVTLNPSNQAENLTGDMYRYLILKPVPFFGSFDFSSITVRNIRMGSMGSAAQSVSSHIYVFFLCFLIYDGSVTLL